MKSEDPRFLIFSEQEARLRKSAEKDFLKWQEATYIYISSVCNSSLALPRGRKKIGAGAESHCRLRVTVGLQLVARRRARGTGGYLSSPRCSCYFWLSPEQHPRPQLGLVKFQCLIISPCEPEQAK